ncbi:MAG TPA: glucose 1-dehydrogenase [Thermomicrobiales bacterium]|nr:glucose 1-dehydrogenase [Thermomicrobiales bacterium]
MGRLDGKVAVITGAGSGLGRAMAARFATEGAAVLATDVDEAGGAATVAGLGRDARAAFRRCDVTDEADCAAAMADATARWGRLDIMVANAGIGGVLAPLVDLDRADWERVLAVNLTGVFLSAKHAFRAMRAGGGVILATASVAGLEGTPRLGAYGPTKAGVIQLVRTLALEGARHHIRANALCPVWIETPMVAGFIDAFRQPAEAMRQRLVADIPLGRLGTPDDVAAAAAYLASDDAAFITGVAFPIDGGHLA